MYPKLNPNTNFGNTTYRTEKTPGGEKEGTFKAKPANNQSVSVSIRKDDKGKMRTALPMGIEVVRNGQGGMMSVLVEEKTLLNQPVRKQREYSTFEDNQTTCTIQVCALG